MILHGDPLENSMFWVGAMFAFFPMMIAAGVVTAWWRWRKRTSTESVAGRPDSGTV